MVMLSPNFSLEELVRSSTAARHGIDNSPPDNVVERLRLLCVHVLQPLRDALERPVRVTSGYRSRRLNQAVGGAPNSQHMEGEAADIVVEGLSVQELGDAIREHVSEFDQLIYEPSWVHVSFSAGRNRGQILRIAP